MKTRIIVFSSKEGIGMARAIQRNLYTEKYSCKLWTNNFFRPSSLTIENLQSIRDDFHYAVIVLSPDDCIISREVSYEVPRDNVIFELGLSIGILGLDRTIIVKPDQLKLPSDLDGITPCNYFPDEDIDTSAGYIVSHIEACVDKAIDENKIVNRIYWNEYCRLIDKLLDALKKSVNFGGYNFDIIVSISRGGIIVSDLLSRTFGYSMPVLYLFADRRNGHGQYDTKSVIENNIYVVNCLKNQLYQNILVVDSAARGGCTINSAMAFLKEQCDEEKNFKSAVLIADTSIKNNNNIDFVVEYRDTKGLDFYYNIYH